MQVALHRSTRSLAALAVGATLAAAGWAASPAEASFVLDKCDGNIAIGGRGATFQQNAQNAWLAAFTTDAAGCTGTVAPIYNTGLPTTATGSGNGRGAMGSGEGNVAPMNVAGTRDNEVRFAGTDEGPESTKQQRMNTGTVGDTADDGLVRVIPVAASANAVVVNYPRFDSDPGAATSLVACPIPATYATSDAAGQKRLRVPNWRLERAFAGKYLTWGEFLADPDAAGAETGLDTASVRAAATGGDTNLDDEYNAGCRDRKVLRVVRQDNSGTTYSFKDYLDYAAAINDNGETPDDPLTGDASNTNWKPGYTFDPNANRSWPDTPADNGSDTEATSPSQNPAYGETAGSQGNNDAICDPTYVAAAATSPVCHATGTGAGAQADVAAKAENNGAIAYMDLATAKAKGFGKQNDAQDVTYILPMAERASVTSYVEASKSATGWQQGVATGGARCDDVAVRDVPEASDPTAGFGWDVTSMVYPATGYGACTLTYALAWTDNAPVYVTGLGNDYDTEERKARQVKDYLDFVTSDAGQAYLVPADYSPLPEALQTLARAGVAKITWDAANIGNRGGEGPGDGNPGGGNPNNGTPGGAVTPVTTTTPPAGSTTPPSNVFTIPSARLRGSAIVASVLLPGQGAVSVTAKGAYSEKKGRKTRKRTLTVGSGRVTVTRAGTVEVRLPLSSAAKSALKKTKRITVTIAVTYTPTGGTAKTVTRTLTLRGTTKKAAKRS